MLSPGNSSTLTAYKGREVVVKLLDHGLSQRFRQLTPSQLKNKVNNILSETPKLTDIKIAAAHQLKSGDITVITNSLDNATKLQTHTEWARGLGPRAEVIRVTYGAIVHGIPVNSINMKDQQGTIQRILAENHSVIPNAEITYIGWLTKDSTKKRNSSMVIEFTRPEMANAIIYAGFLWEGLIRTCQLYDRSCRIKQCLRCCNYGHIGTQCSASQACGHCTGGHEIRECTAKSTLGFVPKCTVCKGSHTAWNAACPARQKEIQRVEKAKQERNHYWPTPPRRTPSTTNSNDGQGAIPPASASNSTSRLSRQNRTTTSVNQTIPEPRVLRSARRLQQRNPTPPQIEPQAAQPGPTVQVQHPVYQPPTKTPTGLDPVTSDVNHLDFLDEEEWLQNLNLNWPDTIAVDPTPGISTIPEDQLHASAVSPRELVRMERRSITLAELPRPRQGCSCEEHQHIYDNWPIQDAELIIGTCMKECPYCGYRNLQTAELRKHLKAAHWRRNLTIRKGKLGEKNIIPG